MTDMSEGWGGSTPRGEGIPGGITRGDGGSEIITREGWGGIEPILKRIDPG